MPVTPAMNDLDDDLNNEEAKKLQEYCDGLFAELDAERRYVEPMWEDIADYLLPEFSGWDFEVERDIVAGEKIYDGAAITAHSRLSDGIFGWLVSPTIPWLQFEPADPKYRDNKPAMEYLRTLEEHLYGVFNRSNFYDAIAEDIHIGTGIGTSVLTAEYAEPLGRPIYEPLHPREVYIAENRYREVDVLCRRYQITHRQVLQEFGSIYDEQTRRDMMKKPESRVTIRHFVFPNEDYENYGGPKVGKNKRFRSVHCMEKGTLPRLWKTKLLRVSGMDIRKFEAWRFEHASGQVYGTCPAMKAIYDIKMINIQSKSMSDVEQLAARPPMQTTEMMKGKLRIAPGGITYGYDEVKPIMTTISYPVGMEAMQRREKIIREHFKTDFFMSISQIQEGSRERTSNEIDQVRAESAAVMGAVIGRIQSERLDPIVRMTLLLEKEAGNLPEPPQGLPGDFAFKLNFIGPLAQSQRKFLRTQGLRNGLNAAMGLAQAAPDSLYNYDLNWASRELAVAEGYPFAGLRSVEETKKMQEQAQAAREAAQKAQMENERLAAAGRGARAAEPGSPTAAMMGQVQ